MQPDMDGDLLGEVVLGKGVLGEGDEGIFI
jgi:hypothetical protein